jgi:hypothetical protein
MNKMNKSNDIKKYLYEDCDSDDEYDQLFTFGGLKGDGTLETDWIQDIETQILCYDYSQFIKTDITNISFDIIYLNMNKEIVIIDRCTLPLLRPNSITQNEIFQLIQKKQRLKETRKYYNFMSLCLYYFHINEDPKSVSQYLSYDDDDGMMGQGGDGDEDGDGDGGGGDGDGVGGGRIIEYTNILSIETIYFKPLIRMFHDMNCITVVLYED